jgi:hypothetical protein
MRGYWDRIHEDRSVAEDDVDYNRLIVFSVIAEDSGCIAIYDCDGTPTIEVSAQADREASPLTACGRFVPSVAAQEATHLREALAKLIRERMTIQ